MSTGSALKFDPPLAFAPAAVTSCILSNDRDAGSGMRGGRQLAVLLSMLGAVRETYLRLARRFYKENMAIAGPICDCVEAVNLLGMCVVLQCKMASTFLFVSRSSTRMNLGTQARTSLLEISSSV